MAEVFKFAVEYGVLGVAVLVLSLAVRAMYNHGRQDRTAKDKQIGLLQVQLSKEQTLRVDDAKRFTDVALKLQAEVISSVASIDQASRENANLCEFVEKLVDAVEDLLDQKKGKRGR